MWTEGRQRATTLHMRTQGRRRRWPRRRSERYHLAFPTRPAAPSTTGRTGSPGSHAQRFRTRRWSPTASGRQLDLLRYSRQRCMQPGMQRFQFRIGCGCLHEPLAVSARELGAYMPNHFVTCLHPLQHLGHIFTGSASAAAGRAHTGPRMHDLFSVQIAGNGRRTGGVCVSWLLKRDAL